MEEIFSIPISGKEGLEVTKALVCIVIMINIISLIAYASAYIQFKRNPPLEKFQCWTVRSFIREFTYFRKDFINATIGIDCIIVICYLLMVFYKLVYLILF